MTKKFYSSTLFLFIIGSVFAAYSHFYSAPNSGLLLLQLGAFMMIAAGLLAVGYTIYRLVNSAYLAAALLFIIGMSGIWYNNVTSYVGPDGILHETIWLPLGIFTALAALLLALSSTLYRLGKRFIY